MKGNKLLLWIFIIIVLCNSINGNLIDEFTNGLSSENLTFTGNENITRTLQIPRYSNVTDGNMILFGKYFFLNETRTYCNFENCDYIDDNNLQTSTYYSFNAFGLSSVQQRNIEYFYKRNYDFDGLANYSINQTIKLDWNGDYTGWDAYKIFCKNETGLQMIYNNTREAGSGAYYNSLNINIDIPISCKNSSDINLTYSGRINHGYIYINESKLLIHNNNNVKISNITIYNKTGIFNSTVQVNFTDSLNSLLPSCTCNGCSISSEYCNVPFTFHSDTAGVLEYSNLNINYSNLLTIYVKDENTGNLIVGKNVSVELFNGDYAYNYTTQTSNNTINIDLPKSNINIRYSGAGYTERIITRNLEISDNNITLYLLNSSSSQECVSVVYNELGIIQEGVNIEVYKYSSYLGKYSFVGSYMTNFEGKTSIYIELNKEYYYFKLYYPSGSLKETTTSTYIYTCPINFQINTQDDIAEDFFRRQEIISNLTYNNNTNTFNLIYNDPNDLSDRYCLYIYTNYTSSNTLNNYSCLSTSTGTISKTVTAINNTKFIAKFRIYQEGYWYTIDTLIHEFKVALNPLKTNPMGLLLILLTTIIIIFMAQKYILSIILVPIPLIIGSAFDIINIELPYAIGIGLFGLIIAFILNRDK
jgi:hypothetical protein